MGTRRGTVVIPGYEEVRSGREVCEGGTGYV